MAGYDIVGNLICVANFPANTGFAWTFIEGLYAELANRMKPDGVSTWVAYPRLEEKPETLEGSPAQAIELPLELEDLSSVLSWSRAIRRLGIRGMYLSDRPTWHPAYAAFRVAGVRSIVVHDHTSGARDVPEGLKRWAKMARYCVPGMSADRAIAVSDFVLERLVRVNLLPPGRTSRIWNSVEVPEALVPEDRRKARLRDLGLDPLRPVVGCASRATPEKGIKPLLLAFDRVWRDFPGREKPQLIYMGSGPAWDEFSRIREKLPSRDGITLAGYVPDAADVLGCVDVAVVPSLWEEAFGLAALEPMARGIPVIASRVGGIPEVIQEGETGLLVSAGDEEALAEAIAHLLTHPSLAEEFGRRGRDRALAAFSREKQVDALESLFREEMRRW